MWRGLLFLFIASLSWYLDTKYQVSPVEHQSLIYIFGAKIGGEIEAMTWVTDDSGKIHDWLAVYFHEKIWINANAVKQFRDRLSIVHEGTHYYQQDYLNRHENSEFGFSAYHLTTYEASNQLPVEKEAELVRELAMLYAKDALGAPIVMEPIFTDVPDFPDFWPVREQMWVYLQVYMKLSRPDIWWLGAE